jgi:hypothetical protein
VIYRHIGLGRSTSQRKVGLEFEGWQRMLWNGIGKVHRNIRKPILGAKIVGLLLSRMVPPIVALKIVFRRISKDISVQMLRDFSTLKSHVFIYDNYVCITTYQKKSHSTIIFKSILKISCFKSNINDNCDSLTMIIFH